MDATLRDIIIGAASAMAPVLLVSSYNAFVRGPKTAKRVGRVEDGIVVLLSTLFVLFDVHIITLRCLGKKKLNGEVKQALDKIEEARKIQRKYLAGAAISQKEKE